MSVKPIKAPALNSEEFELVPAEVYLARCYRMIDLGTHEVDGQFGAKDVHQVVISWELLKNDDDEPVFMSDGKSVFTINKKYTLSMHKKSNLRSDLDGWRGIAFTEEEASEFDITNLINKFCKIQVMHNTNGDKTYANVKNISHTRKTADVVNKAYTFSLEDRDMEVFEGLSDYYKAQITSSYEWTGKSDDKDINQEIVDDSDDKPIDLSEIPFN
jgi:hypothetical protein